MELRLFPPHADQRWHTTKRLTFQQPQPPPRLRTSHELPFSPELLRAFRFGVAPEAPDLERPPPPARAATSLVETPRQWPSKQQRILDYRGERGDRCDQAFKCAQWLLLFVALTFVAVVVVMLSMVFVRVGAVLDRVGGSDVQAKFDRVLDHALQAAMHTETATGNAAAVSAMARTAATEAQPRLFDALNQTTDIMAELHDFSLHPQWTLSAGTRRRRSRD